MLLSRNNSKMSQDLLNHKEKCRLCFQRISDTWNNTAITKNVQEKFFRLTNVELKSSDKFSNSICKTCTHSLNDSAKFQCKMIGNQLRLYAFVKEADSQIVKEEAHGSSIIHFEPVNIEDVLPKTEVFEFTSAVDCQTPASDVDVSRPATPDDAHFEPQGVVESPHIEEPEPVVSRKRKYSDEQMQKAVEAVASFELSASAAAKQFNVPPSTLKSKVERDLYFLLTAEEEACVKIKINKRSERGALCNIDDIKLHAMQVLRRRRWRDRVQVSELSNSWALAFRKRHLDMNMEPPEKVECSCDVCGITTADLRNMRLHMSIHSENYLAKPLQWLYRTYTRKTMSEALKVLQEGTAEFDEVSKRFNIPLRVLKRSLKKLKKKESGSNEIFKCSYCDRTFSRDYSRRHHELSTHLIPAGEFPCKECGKVFKTKNCLRGHVRGVHLIGVFKCYECGEEFQRSTVLERHKRIHKPKIACEICGKLVEAGSSYNVHLKTHAPKDTFKCNFEGCSQTYHSKHSFIYHTMSHGPNQNIKCPKCSSTFPNQTRLRVHDARMHVEAKFICMVEGCSYKNRIKQYLKMHLRNHKNIDVKYRDELIANVDARKN